MTQTYMVYCTFRCFPYNRDKRQKQKNKTKKKKKKKKQKKWNDYCKTIFR